MNITTGVLLLNLGGPDSLEAVKPFLYNLFSDRKIIRLGPLFLQKPIASLISLVRAKKTERMYTQIGGRSPILDITNAQASALEKRLNEVSGKNSLNRTFKVFVGMRYWHPFIKDTVMDMINQGIKDIIVLTLYPQYSRTTTGSAISEFKRTIEESGIMDLKIQYIDQWYDFPPYIDALASIVFDEIRSIKNMHFALIYSAHSLPRSFIEEGDPYLDHVKKTVGAVNSRLKESPYGVKDIKWFLSFQSRTGPVKWLEPSTDEVIREIAKADIRHIIIVPVSFVSDHIETLYEIDILYKNMAQEMGLELHRCRALNTLPEFINALAELVMRTLK